MDSNYTEYIAVINALKLINRGGTIHTDSQMVVDHLNGVTKTINDKYLDLYNEALALKVKTNAKVVWVSRNKNRAGQELERFISSQKRMIESNVTFIPMEGNVNTTQTINNSASSLLEIVETSIGMEVSSLTISKTTDALEFDIKLRGK